MKRPLLQSHQPARKVMRQTQGSRKLLRRTCGKRQTAIWTTSARPDPRTPSARAKSIHRSTARRYDAASASRNCRFITLPLALRGNGSTVSAIVSGTL